MPETWTLAELLNAGWTEADLEWEKAMAGGVAAFAASDAAVAVEQIAKSVQLARTHFEPEDPRLATSLANYGVCLRAAGRERDGCRLREEARGIWSRCDSWVDSLTAPRSARSSLFHLRMEQKHRGTYEERWRIKWRELVDEARARLAEPDSGSAALAQQSAARWKRECPAMLNDSRKLMAAVIFLLAPGEP